jgi:hypothetical protein
VAASDGAQDSVIVSRSRLVGSSAIAATAIPTKSRAFAGSVFLEGTRPLWRSPVLFPTAGFFGSARFSHSTAHRSVALNSRLDFLVSAAPFPVSSGWTASGRSAFSSPKGTLVPPIASNSDSESAGGQSGAGALGLGLGIGAVALVALSLLIAFVISRSRRGRAISAGSGGEMRTSATPSFEGVSLFDVDNLATQTNPVLSTHWDECLFTNNEPATGQDASFVFLE